jgi:hypothetical protein
MGEFERTDLWRLCGSIREFRSLGFRLASPAHYHPGVSLEKAEWKQLAVRPTQTRTQLIHQSWLHSLTGNVQLLAKLAVPRSRLK